jgi:hypothetical protein|tara:strand:+ start:334 stop:588 length:255 start_codon:yes stop_codon:yes gene_type:complete
MKIKMKKDVVGAIDNGGSTMLYKTGQTYQMNTKLEMEMATVWMNDGRAEKGVAEKATKVVNDMEKKVEKKSKGILKKVFGKKNK